MKKIHNILSRMSLTGIVLLASAASVAAQDYLYIYKNGGIRHREEVANVDSVAMEKGKTQVSLYDKQHNVLYSAPRSEVDSISMSTTVPQADLLDVRFLDDGTAVDVSPMKIKIEKVGNTQSVIYSETYKRNIACFANPWGGTGTGYYKANFESNTKFRNALANGHTLECLVMASYSGSIPNSEAKPFSAMEAGGTGFLVTTTSGSRKNELTFLPNISTSGSSTWRWATSGVVPASQTYYHVVGVWNKQEKKAYVYVNGELHNTVDASGEMHFASSGSNWFCIGGDAAGSGCGNGWNGNVVLARAYDDPLTASQVGELWQQVKVLQDYAVPDMITSINYLIGLTVPVGGTYHITAEGFEEGDMLKLESVETGFSATVPVVLTENGCTIVLPEGITSGSYRMTVIRGERSQMIGITQLQVSSNVPAGMKVIAHRGHWNVSGSAQNSRSSLSNAFAEKCYGSETDVWITRDGHIMVNHDAALNGVTIESSSYNMCKRLSLSNGEKMPELKEFLDLLEKEDSTKLIIEIKTHSSETRGKACVDSVVAQVKERGLQDKVEYIAFSLNLARQVVMRDSSAHVAYLNGDLPPSTLYKYGIMGLDYTADNYRSHPTWAAEARKLGMTTNVWTIDDAPTMIEMANMGIDYVTTNNPVTAKEIYAAYAENYKPGDDDPEEGDKDSAEANLLDIRFNADGTVEDVSPMKHTVQVVSADNKTVPVEYNEEYGTYAAHLNNTWGGGPSTYCKVDYSTDMDFKLALADGHTLETVFCGEFSGTIPNKEAKWFSSHQGGGTGFLISTQSGSRKNEITFLPNVSTSGTSTWRWATSGIVPESGKYYHVVGVWNAEEEKAYIYVNGELRNTVDAPGSMIFPSNGCNWFGIGCDPSGANSGEASGNWHIVRARIYDKPLTPEEVEKLW